MWLRKRQEAFQGMKLADYEELLEFAAQQGVTELKIQGLEAKLSPPSNVDKALLEDLRNKVNQLSMAVGMFPANRKVG